MNSSNISGTLNAAAGKCVNYRVKWPTTEYMFRHPPPEYFPMLGVAMVLFLLTSLLLIIDVVFKHSKYLREGHFKLSSRVIMMLTAYWLFALTGLLGMVFLRGDIYLHFIANTYESACILAFFDMVIIHRRSIDEPFADRKVEITIRVPPCCCCLVCLPMFRNTKKNLHRSRYAIYQLIFFQSGVEFIRVLTVFDCRYDANSTRTQVFDGLVFISFLFAMWALFILIKNQHVKLAKFRYVKKFWGFKLIIVVTKTLHKVLVLLAKGNHISEYGDLGSEARALIWKHFITVVLTFLLLLYSRNLYTIDDYNSMLQYKVHCNEDGEEEPRTQRNNDEEQYDEEEEEREEKI